MAIPDHQRGSALLTVTWFLALIGIIASFLLYRAETEWAAVVNLERNYKFRQLAEEALHDRLALFLADDPQGYDTRQDAWLGDGGRFEERRDGYQITVLVEDEGSKPNINLVSRGFQAVELRELSIDPLLDWRDPDSEPLMDGAEEDDYQALNPPYQPRNGFFSSLEEIKQVKDGAKLYPVLAPEFTVFGKVNPNTISAATFANLLESAGFEKNLAERAANSFTQYRASPNNRFTQISDFERLDGITQADWSRMKPLFQFGGACNLNLARGTGLAVILAEAGYPSGLLAQVVPRQAANPFKSQDEIRRFFLSANKNIAHPEDYFTVISTVVRYRIWVTQGRFQYYLDTVQERFVAGIAKQWRARTLSWRVCLNDEAPEIPQTDTGEQPVQTSGGPNVQARDRD
ncbi:type II secretory pathway component PulK [Hydrogenispora ethanolica]|uniref:Type II secretory pathway component PulK n=1 Tax=Hydrogenispora ethanolica TaxID=1082276 RepID=A0A4R1QLB3_HYDET|nr:type II secretion system protein GspK [Hydrogenispora ethanolica]TCL54489.1 type II secretory pathway component PulK [Hydrogenispora ethanolica]